MLYWGIWSDGTTVWVGDNDAKNFRAYTLDTEEREESKDIAFARYHSWTGGIWSDGSTMWTAHRDFGGLSVAYSRIFSHTLPTSGGADTCERLNRHCLSGVTLVHCDPPPSVFLRHGHLPRGGAERC